MVSEVPKKWTHRIHTVTPGDSVGTIFWVVSPLKGEPINTFHWKETMATNPRFSVIYFRSVVFFLLGSLIIIPCARTNVPKIEEIRRGSAVFAAVATLVRTSECTARTAIRCTCSIDHLRLSLWHPRLGLLFGSSFLFVSQIFLFNGGLSCVWVFELSSCL
jgi:hypothetical protein